jgi:arginase
MTAADPASTSHDSLPRTGPARIAVIDAPSVLGLFPGGVEQLPQALHAHGLTHRLRAEAHHQVQPPPYSGIRDPATGLRNPDTIVTYAESLARVVGGCRDRGEFPLVLGGDCSIILGPLLALAERGTSGLLFLDGHADFAHPRDEPTGEAASMDLALATGRGSASFGPVGGRTRLVGDEHVAVLGYRVHDDGTDTCAGVHITSTPITAIDLTTIRSVGLDPAVDHALRVVDQPQLDGFWIHIDADVLSDDDMPAVDYRHPGGLTWAELERICRTALHSGRALGLDLTIFNPTLDPTQTIAQRLVDFLADVLTDP